MATPLKQYLIPNFAAGYDSFVGSKSMIKPNEIPQGAYNIIVDDNGSASKVNGSAKFGPEIASGKQIRGLGQFITNSINKVICAAGTAWYDVTSTTKTALTGVTFTDDKETFFFIGEDDRYYGVNGVDNLCYTKDGSTITEVSANGKVAVKAVNLAQRIYAIRASDPRYLDFSNPIKADGTVGDYGTFDTNLSANPVKNAGSLKFPYPLTNVEVASEPTSDNIYVYDSRNIWKVTPASTLASDNSLPHTVKRLVMNNGTPSARGVQQVGNDKWHYAYDNIYSLGEVAQFQNIRTTTKSGRVKAEIASIATSGRSKVALGFFKDKMYMAYQTGTFNDALTIYDTRLNAWSSPITGKNISCFLDYEAPDGTHRFLTGSSNSAKSYIYELESGTDDDDTAISASFETISTDCDLAGVIKRFAFVQFFYSMVYGTVSYEVLIDEVIKATGTLQLGNSDSEPTGIGSQEIGLQQIGYEQTETVTFASLKQNDDQDIDTSFEEGKKISVRFWNANKGEQFKINKVAIWFMPGSPFESL